MQTAKMCATLLLVSVSVLWFLAETLILEPKDLRKTLPESYFSPVQDMQMLRIDTYDRYVQT